VTFGRVPRSSSTIGLEVVRMIEAIDRSNELGGAKVAVSELDPLSLANTATRYVGPRHH
jgi:hypothetical protein